MTAAADVKSTTTAVLYQVVGITTTTTTTTTVTTATTATTATTTTSTATTTINTTTVLSTCVARSLFLCYGFRYPVTSTRYLVCASSGSGERFVAVLPALSVPAWSVFGASHECSRHRISP